MALLQGFASVNERQQAVELQTQEAKELRVIQAWEGALALVAAQRDDEAEAALRALLAEPVVEEPATDQLQRIKFLALRSLAELLARRPGGAPAALAAYCAATEVDGDDTALWNRLGSLAAEAGYWAAARSAFERGLALDPAHPTMADKLLQLLLHVGDGGAAGALAAAMLRRNPRHAGAAAAAADAAAARPPAALRGGLLQLAPLAAAAPGGRLPVAAPTQQPAQVGWGWHHSAPERPRTLDQPTWQQLLHHSLLFLSSNKLAPAEAAPATPATAAAGAAASPSLDAAHKGVPAFVRFNIKRAQPAAAQPGAAAQGAAATAAPAAAGTPQASQQPRPADGAGPAANAAAPAPAAAQAATPAAPAGAGSDAAPAVAEAAPGGEAAATTAAATPLAPTPLASEPGSGAVPRSAAAQACAPADTPAADEEQEQRHPNGAGARASGSSRKLEARATRSRAATGKAGPPLVPTGEGGEAQASPEEEAADLLSTLGSLLSMPQQAVAGPGASAAASPLLASPSIQLGCRGGGGGSGGQPAVADAAADAAQQKEEEAAVKAFLKRLPQQGVGRHELSVQLLDALASRGAAAKLAPAARQQLLQLAHHAQHSVAHLPPDQCLVLGELFAEAAAAAAAAAQRAGGAPAPAQQPASNSGSPQLQRSGPQRRPSGRARRSELPLATLQQSTRLWLSRYRLAAMEQAAGAEEPAAEGVARYWWAIGRLMESCGDMPGAAAAYAACKDALPALGGRTIPLDHCAPGTGISAAAVHSKQEALQLHSVLEGAEAAASRGEHAAVAAALAPVLLCCTAKEQQMLAMGAQQWQRGLQMLLAAAAAQGSWALALRCHLRLLNALLPAVPPQLGALIRDQQEQAGGPTAGGPLPLMLAAANQVAAQPAAISALDAAAGFLHKHGVAVVLAHAGAPAGTAQQEDQQAQQGSQQRQQGQQRRQQQQRLVLHPMEAAMYEAVQHQLVALLAGCSAALAVAGPAAQSHLNMKVNAQRATMCDAATALLRLCSLAAGGDNAGASSASGTAAGLVAVERAQERAWLLCDALGTAQALMDRHGRFAQVCLAELQLQLRRLQALSGAADTAAAAAAAGEEGASDAEELRAVLTAGLQHCLAWLFGLELPGLDEQEEWGGDFQAKGGGDAAARQLTSRQAVAEVWPLVEPHLLQDLQHLSRHRDFLLAAAEQFRRPPPSVARRSAAAWRQLAAAEPPLLPCDDLDTAGAAGGDPMTILLGLAAARGGDAEAAAAASPPAQPEPMAVDGQEAGGDGAGGDAAASPAAAGAAAAAGEGVGEMTEEEAGQYAGVTRSLFYLLSVLQDAEEAGGRSLLGPDAEAALEARLQAARWDLCYAPGRCETWERLAVEYHVAADDLLNEASRVLTHPEWKYQPGLQRRERAWRRMAYWASAGAWLTAADDDERVRLLTATGSRLLEGVLRTLPCQDPAGPDAGWAAAKAEAAHAASARAALEAYAAAETLLESAPEQATYDWEVTLRAARCRRKLGPPVQHWLPNMARACAYAARHDGGVLLPLYALHAARMRALLAMPSARRWAAPGGGHGGDGGSSARRRQRGGRGGREPSCKPEEERELLGLLGEYCFLPATNRGLCSPGLGGGSGAGRGRAGGSGGTPAAAEGGADAELAADWRRLLDDCCAAMRWCLEKDRGFHRAAHRLAAAWQAVGEPHQAVAALAPLFSRAKQAFAPVMAPIREAQVDTAGRKRGRPAKAGRQAPQPGGPSGEGEGEDLPPCRWGEAPPLVASVGLQEDEATFGTRFRKTARLYLSCLADAALAEAEGRREAEAGRPQPLDVLQAAAAYLGSPPAGVGRQWEGMDRLARGHYLLALAACLHTCCPLEQLQMPEAPQAPPSVPPPSAGREAAQQTGEAPAGHQTPGNALRAAAAAGAATGTAPRTAAALGTAPRTAGAPASATHATPADGAAVRGPWRALPTPATQGRQQLSAALLQVAARLEGGRAEPLLAKAHAVHAELSLHAEDEDRWRSEAAPCMQQAQSLTTSPGLAADADLGALWKQPDLLRRMLGLYATLYVHLLQRQGEGDRLLQLLLGMKKRLKSCAGADPRQARFLRRQALVLSESLLGTLDAGLDALDLASELEGAPMPSAQQQQHQHQHQHQQQQQQQQQRQWQAGDADGAAADQPPPPPQQQPQQAAEASAAEPMEVEGAAGQQQEGQQQGSPPAAGAPPAVAAAGEQPSPAAPAAATQATATPAAPAGGQGRHATTPGTDLRAALGTPLAALLSAEQQQLQERGLALLQVAWGFHKEVSRWLQLLGGTSTSATGTGARDELRAVGRSGEQAVLRAYRLYAGITQPGAAAASMSRADQLKAAEEAVKAQRRQSRQAGKPAAAGGAAAAAGGGAGPGLLPAIAEAAEERQPGAAPAAAGRKRAAAGEAAPPRSTRKRGRSRSNTAEPDAAAEGAASYEGEQQEEGVPAGAEEAEARSVEQVVEDVVAGAVAASGGDETRAA